MLNISRTTQSTIKLYPIGHKPCVSLLLTTTDATPLSER